MREGRGGERGGEAERKGGVGNRKTSPRAGRCSEPRPSSELVCAARAAGAHPLRSKGPGRRHGQAHGALALPASFSLGKTRILENLGESGTPGLPGRSAGQVCHLPGRSAEHCPKLEAQRGQRPGSPGGRGVTEAWPNWAGRALGRWRGAGAGAGP